VFKINNKTLKQKFELKRASLEREIGSSPEIWEAFHGSPFAEEIAKEGFKASLSFDYLRFGAGIYMAPNSSKANHYTFCTNYEQSLGCHTHDDEACKLCTRRILMCKCIMGKEYTMKKPANKIPNGYDSMVANPAGNPELMEFLQYPEYVIRDTDQVRVPHFFLYFLLSMA
jgi:Poly(ADP-ribose) polymerase catalytic domain